ncbi:unnamed protein product [Phytophthora lilii]|uniref:Unnamed protein product n=1 Tax=Phytophthora lilii TaxID=2077276 RepID=A0A9W7CS95_9STRA|nr:unnamed protein product [Phytophthora lilii]
MLALMIMIIDFLQAALEARTYMNQDYIGDFKSTLQTAMKIVESALFTGVVERAKDASSRNETSVSGVHDIAFSCKGYTTCRSLAASLDTASKVRPDIAKPNIMQRIGIGGLWRLPNAKFNVVLMNMSYNSMILESMLYAMLEMASFILFCMNAPNYWYMNTNFRAALKMPNQTPSYNYGVKQLSLVLVAEQLEPAGTLSSDSEPAAMHKTSANIEVAAPRQLQGTKRMNKDKKHQENRSKRNATLQLLQTMMALNEGSCCYLLNRGIRCFGVRMIQRKIEGVTIRHVTVAQINIFLAIQTVRLLQMGGVTSR